MNPNINDLQGKRDKLEWDFFDRRDQIRVEVDAMLGTNLATLHLQQSLSHLFTI